MNFVAVQNQKLQVLENAQHTCQYFSSPDVDQVAGALTKGTSYEIVSRGDSVVLAGISGTWYIIRLPNGQQVYTLALTDRMKVVAGGTPSGGSTSTGGSWTLTALASSTHSCQYFSAPDVNRVAGNLVKGNTYQVVSKGNTLQIAGMTGTWYVIRLENGNQVYTLALPDRIVVNGAPSTNTGSTVIPPAHNKIIYLTFDDGPSANTARLLQVLAQYGVKATFFVTNAAPAYQYMIGKEAAAGHTIGVHTYTHNYAQIYASEAAYMNDFNAMNNIVQAQTGSRAKIFRFPGGSSNTVSRRYNSGIMTRLAASMQKMGYVYFDWNVSSGDAGETTSTSVVAANVIRGVQQYASSIVLQHDSKSYSVAAVEQILRWGMANGYTFLPLSAQVVPVHHHIAN